MPWNDPRKCEIISKGLGEKRRFLAHAGVVDERSSLRRHATRSPHSTCAVYSSNASCYEPPPAVALGEADGDASPEEAGPSQCERVANEPRPVTAADLEAIVDLGFARCGWRPTSQEPWRIQGLGASENGQQDDDLLMSFYAEDIDRVGDALDKDDMRSGLFPYLRGEDASGRVDLNEDVGALTAGGCTPRSCLWGARQANPRSSPRSSSR